jgi:hypothetical protein
MPYTTKMAIDRITFTVSAELGTAIRDLAAELGVPVSSIVATSVERHLRQRSLGEAVQEAQDRIGPNDRDLVNEVSAAFDRATRTTRTTRATRATRGERDRSDRQSGQQRSRTSAKTGDGGLVA